MELRLSSTGRIPEERYLEQLLLIKGSKSGVC